MMRNTILEIEQLQQKAAETRDAVATPELATFKLSPPQGYFDTLIERLEAQRRHSGQRYTIMLLGEFNAGKSTLLNAMLGLSRSEGLSVNAKPETAKPTRITQRTPGDPEAKLILHDNSEKPLASWKEARDESTLRAKHEEVREVVFFHDHPLLCEADILDMPGTGAAFHQSHQDLTREYLANAEMVVWVIGNQEPSRAGLDDFRTAMRMAAQTVVVFNAWGAIDREVDEGDFSQQEIEESVRANFPEAFRIHETGFRVFAGKCLQSIERGLPDEHWSADYGMKAWLGWLTKEYLETLPDKSEVRRHRVMDQVRRLAADAARDSNDWIPEWEMALEREEGEKRQLKRRRKQARNLEVEIKAKIADLARTCSQSILDKIKAAYKCFIDDKISLQNAFDGHDEKANKRLESELKEKYLKLNERPNWIEEEFREYLQKCEHVLHAEWKLFLEEVNLDMPKDQGPQKRADDFSPYEQASKNAKGCLFFEGLATVLAIVLSIMATRWALLWFLRYMGDGPLEKVRTRAKHRAATQFDLQSSGLRNELLDVVMNGPFRNLQQQFEREMDDIFGAASVTHARIAHGLKSLQQFHDAMSLSAHE